jgi:hypothetical protein
MTPALHLRSALLLAAVLGGLAAGCSGSRDGAPPSGARAFVAITIERRAIYERQRESKKPPVDRQETREKGGPVSGRPSLSGIAAA